MRRTDWKVKFRDFNYFLRFFWPYWKLLGVLILALQVSVFTGLVNPYISKLIIDDAYKNRNLKLFLILISIGFFVFILNSLLNLIKAYLTEYIRKDVEISIRNKVVSHLYALPLAYFKDTSRRDNLYKVTRDIDSISHLITDVAERVLYLVPTVIVTFVIVFYLNWQIAIFIVVVSIFYYFHSLYFGEKRESYQEEIIKIDEMIFRRLAETLANIHLIKASAKEKSEEEMHADLLKTHAAQYLNNVRFRVLSDFSSGILGKIFIGCVTLYCGYNIIKGNMTLGTMTAILLYIGRISRHQHFISLFFQDFNVGGISCRRVKHILEQERETEESDGRVAIRRSDFEAKIDFKNVSFSYIDGMPILKDFNMDVIPGQCVGLVGPSGCGKSTAMNLLLGLYPPNKGEIFISGTSLKEIDYYSLRKNITISLQEPYLSRTTIENNLKFFKTNATDREVEDVVKNVALDKMLTHQPNGIKTLVGDEACRLSEGQKERISLGRAILPKPKMLILDEALSFIDNETAIMILENIKRNCKNLTLILITHNPHLLKYTDKVVYMSSDLKAIEESHEKLMLHDDYKKLFDIKTKEKGKNES